MANIFGTMIMETLIASIKSEITCWGGSMFVVDFLYFLLFLSLSMAMPGH
jgi:hypothetical protein